MEKSRYAKAAWGRRPLGSFALGANARCGLRDTPPRRLLPLEAALAKEAELLVTVLSWLRCLSEDIRCAISIL